MNDDAPSRLRSGTGLGTAHKQGGFTIVETLIVLAVSGLLLLSAVVLVAGQQQKVEFSQSVEDIRSSIEQTISEVGAGYYPNPGNISCTVSSGSLSITANTGTQQGSNTGCIFLGKAIEFGVKDTDPQQYIVHSIAALQDNDGTLAGAKPQAIDIDGARDVKTLRNGLRAVSMKYVKGSVKTDVGAVAFISSLGDMDATNQLVSGSQQALIVPVGGSGNVPNTTIGGVVGAVSSQLATSPVNPDGGVQICFNNGGNRSAMITIGSNGRTPSVKSDFKNSGDCS